MPEQEGWRGKVGGMSREEMDSFLERGLPLYLSYVKPDGHPHGTVIWQEWRDGAFWLVGRERAEWAQHVIRDPRVGFVVNFPETLEKVEGEGILEVVEEPNLGGQWVEITNRMALRYIGEHGPEYVKSTLHQPRWLLRITPTQFTTWQGWGWARKYWVEGTEGPTWEEVHT
jgi:hypothetical protein